MFGTYTPDALREISPERTGHLTRLVDCNGGKGQATCAGMGEHDLVLIVDLTDAERAGMTAVGIARPPASGCAPCR